MERSHTPLVSVVGISNSGKTTLVTGLVKVLKRAGYSVGTIKHHLHDFEMDKPGKDSWLHRKAGASGTIISSPISIGMVKNADHDHTPQELAELLPDADIILAEGYKNSNTPKIEVFRSDLAESPLCLDDPLLIAIVSESEGIWDGPRFLPGDFEGISNLLIKLFINTSE